MSSSKCELNKNAFLVTSRQLTHSFGAGGVETTQESTYSAFNFGKAYTLEFSCINGAITPEILPSSGLCWVGKVMKFILLMILAG